MGELLVNGEALEVVAPIRDVNEHEASTVRHHLNGEVPAARVLVVAGQVGRTGAIGIERLYGEFLR